VPWLAGGLDRRSWNYPRRSARSLHLDTARTASSPLELVALVIKVAATTAQWVVQLGQ
jgi:hypothetical protein